VFTNSQELSHCKGLTVLVYFYFISRCRYITTVASSVIKQRKILLTDGEKNDVRIVDFRLESSFGGIMITVEHVLKVVEWMPNFQPKQ